MTKMLPSLSKQASWGWMNLPAGHRPVGCGPEPVEHLLGPVRVVAQVHDHLIVLVEDGDAGVQVGNEQVVAPDVEMGREADVRLAKLRGLPSSVKCWSRSLARSATTS